MPAIKAMKKVLPPSAKKIARRVAPAPAPPPVPVDDELSQARARAAMMPPINPAGDSDLSLAMREMIKGGKTRQEVMHRVRDQLNGKATRNGKPKPVSTIMNHALNRAEAHGYQVVQSWILVPIPGHVEPEKAPTKRAVKAAASQTKKVAVRKVAVKKTVAGPVPVKKKVGRPAKAAGATKPAAQAPVAVKRIAVRKPAKTATG